MKRKKPEKRGACGSACLGTHLVGFRRRGRRETAVKYRNCSRGGGACAAGAAEGSISDLAYMEKLISQTWDMIGAGAIDMDAARIGYDIRTGASVWDYNSLLKQLVAAGHCCECAKNFVDSFSQVAGADGVFENVMVITKADQAVEAAAIKRHGQG